MKRSAILAVTVIGIITYPWVYWRLYGSSTVYLLTPDLLNAARHFGGHTALVALHFIASVLISAILVLPIAILIAVVFRRHWWAPTLLLGTELVWPDIIGMSDAWRAIPDHAAIAVGIAVDFMTVFVTAVCIAFLLSRWVLPGKPPLATGR
jgi:hypothetical protein